MLWSCKLLWMCGSSYKIQGEGASKKMKFYPQKLKKNKVTNCFCCLSNWNDSCRFKKRHCLKIKWGKMGDGVEGLERRPIRAGPARKWRRNLSGHFLADSINPGTEEPHTSSAGTRKPGYCSHMAISWRCLSMPKQSQNLGLSARKTQAATWGVESSQYKEMTHTWAGLIYIPLCRGQWNTLQGHSSCC